MIPFKHTSRLSLYIVSVILTVGCSAFESQSPFNGLIDHLASKDGIFVVTDETRLTYNKSDVYSISWSGNGQNIIYSLLDPNRGVANAWLMKSDGTSPKRLTKLPFNDYDPSLSPSGEEVVFFSDRTGNTDIWVIKKLERNNILIIRK